MRGFRAGFVTGSRGRGGMLRFMPMPAARRNRDTGHPVAETEHQSQETERSQGHQKHVLGTLLVNYLGGQCRDMIVPVIVMAVLIMIGRHKSLSE